MAPEDRHEFAGRSDAHVLTSKTEQTLLHEDQPQNELVIRIQPDEAIYYRSCQSFSLPLPTCNSKFMDDRRDDLEAGSILQMNSCTELAVLSTLFSGERVTRSHRFAMTQSLAQAVKRVTPQLGETSLCRRILAKTPGLSTRAHEVQRGEPNAKDLLAVKPRLPDRHEGSWSKKWPRTLIVFPCLG